MSSPPDFPALYAGPIHDYLILVEGETSDDDTCVAPAASTDPSTPTPPGTSSSHSAAQPSSPPLRPRRSLPPPPDVPASLAAAAAAAASPHTVAVGNTSVPVFRPWRIALADQIRTSNAVLVLCLNVGVDPPGISRPSPCARSECWVDPTTYLRANGSSAAASDIGRALQAQYEQWQRRAIYKVTLDPTNIELRKICTQLRRDAKEDRVLFHYNGHGVPVPTESGEVWVFSREYENYIPLGLNAIQKWVGKPGLYVFDCSRGGRILTQFLRYAREADDAETNAVRIAAERDAADALQASAAGALGGNGVGGAGPGGGAGSSISLSDAGTAPEAGPSGEATASDARLAIPFARKLYIDSVVLAACGADEFLPMHPDLPADLFTTCLTTPIKISLRWFLKRSTHQNLSVDLLDHIPGALNDRLTPLGSLNWIFTAVTDTIAWSVLPHGEFRRLFRQDLLLASLMRNFLLANRIMKTYGVTPVSHPSLPETHTHRLWSSYDSALEDVICQLPEVFNQQIAVQAETRRQVLFSKCEQLFKDYEAVFNDDAGIEKDSDEVVSSMPTWNGKPYLWRERASDRLHKKHSVPRVEEGRVKWFNMFKSAEKQSKECARLRLLCTDEPFVSSPFFEKQMDAFKIMLDLKSDTRGAPECLPIMLQILLNRRFRVKALHLLSRFLQSGTEAADLAMSIGYFQYINVLLGMNQVRLIKELAYIWGKIVFLDPSTVTDFVVAERVEGGGVKVFKTFLEHSDMTMKASDVHPTHLVMALFVLARVAEIHADRCRSEGVLAVCHRHMSHENALVRRWAVLCVHQILTNSADARADLLSSNELVERVLLLAAEDKAPDVRSASFLVISGIFLDFESRIRLGDRHSSIHLPSHGSLQSGDGRAGTSDNNSRSSSPMRDGNYASGRADFDVSTSSAPSSYGRAEAAGGISSVHGSSFAVSDEYPVSRHPQSGSLPAPASCLDEGASQQRNAFVRNTSQRVAVLLSDASLNSSSVMVRRQVASTLHEIALKRFDLFRHGHQLRGLRQQRQNYDEILEPDVDPNSDDGLCYNLFMSLRRLAFDAHPMVHGYARFWFEKLNSFVSDDSVSLSQSHHNSFGVGSSATPHGLPPGRSHISATSRRRRSRPYQIPAGNSLSTDLNGHMRSGSGNLDLSRVTVQRSHGGGVTGTVPTGIGEAQELYDRRSSSSALLNGGRDDSSLKVAGSALANGVGQLIKSVSQTFQRRSSSGEASSSRGGQNRSPSTDDLFGENEGVGLAVSFGSVGSGYSGAPVGGGSLGAEIGTGARLGVGGMSSAQLLPRSQGGQSPSSPTTMRTRRPSYHFLDRLASSPQAKPSVRLPMPRTGSFIVSPAGATAPAAEVQTLPRSRFGSSLGLIEKVSFEAGSKTDTVPSLYDWSISCVNRLVFETDSPDCVIPPVPDSADMQLGVQEDAYDFCLNMYLDGLGGDGEEDSAEDESGPLSSEDSSWTELVDSFDMCASNDKSSILSMLFLYRHVGHGRDSLLVTGDSSGRVGVYNTQSGTLTGSFGVPGPPGHDEKSGVTAILSLNSPPSSSVFDDTYESAIILGGTCDGRIAVFKSGLELSKEEFRAGKNSFFVVSAFQGSGLSVACNRRFHNILPLGAMPSESSESIASVATADAPSVALGARRACEASAVSDLRRNGNGLVLSYYAPSSLLAAGGCQRGVVRTWDLKAERSVLTKNLLGKEDGVLTALTMVDRDCVAFGASDGTVGIWDMRVPVGEAPHVMGCQGSPIVSTAGSPCTRREEPDCGVSCEYFLSADADGWVYIYDARMSGGEIGRTQAHASVTTTMTHHPKRRIFASASQGGCVKMFNEHRSLTGMVSPRTEGIVVHPVTALSFRPDARLLAVGASDGSVSFYKKEGSQSPYFGA